MLFRDFLSDTTGANELEVAAQSLSGDPEMIELFSVVSKSPDPEQVFVQAFAIADDIKSLYKRLAKVAHPDTGGSSDLFHLMNSAYTEFRENIDFYREAYAVQKESDEICAGSTLSPEELREWLSGKVSTCDSTLSSEELDVWFQ